MVGRITEWEEGPDSVELCGVCRLTHVGSVPLWFDHQRCDFPCYRCTNTYCIYVYVVLIHTIYIHVLHWSLMVMDSPSCGHCAGHGGGEETTLDHVTCHVTSWKVTVFFVDLIKDLFSLACTFECNSQSCVLFCTVLCNLTLNHIFEHVIHVCLIYVKSLEMLMEIVGFFFLLMSLLMTL